MNSALMRSATLLQEKEKTSSEVRTVPSASAIIDNQPSFGGIKTTTNKVEEDSQTFGYPIRFRNLSKEYSYGVTLKIIICGEDCYNLCHACPAGRPRKKFARKAKTDRLTQRIEHKLLASNSISALFGCSNIERCEGYLVKVVFQ